MLSTTSALLVALQVLAWVHPSSAGQIAAWYPIVGVGSSPVPQVVMWNATLGKLQYSLCNSNTTIFTGDESATFDFLPEHEPMEGTSVSGFSYVGDLGFTTNIWYQINTGAIGEAIYICDGTTGLYPFDNQSNWDITSSLDPALSVRNLSGIAAFNLGAKSQRVFVQNSDFQPVSLRYDVDSQLWHNEGILNQDPEQSFGLAAASADILHFTVMTSASTPTGVEQRLDVAYYQQNNMTWNIETIPQAMYLNKTYLNTTDPWITNKTDWNDPKTFEPGALEAPDWSLEAYNGSVDLGLVLDSYDDPTVFYIGTDALLHEYQHPRGSGTWEPVAAQDRHAWPEADAPYANLGVTYSGSDIRIYYTIDGTLTEVAYLNGTWKSSSVPRSANTTSSSGGGLSKSGKIGVGVGVGLGVPLLLAACAAYIFWHTKRSRANRDRETAAVQAAHAEATTKDDIPQNPGAISYPASPAPQYTSGTYGNEGYWSNGQWVPKEQTQQFGNTQGWGAQESKGGFYQELPSQDAPQELPTQQTSTVTSASPRPVSEMPSDSQFSPRGTPAPVSPQIDHGDEITRL